MEKGNFEMKFFEFYAKKLWPIQRFFVKKNISKRCSNCGLSEKASKLNEQDICEYCSKKSLKSKKYYNIKKAKKELKKFLTDYQNKGTGRYDALLLMSGGKDSAFLAYWLKKEYSELRILGLTVDGGFISPGISDNLYRTLKITEIEHIFFKAKSSLFNEVFRTAFINLTKEKTKNIDKKGCSQVIDRINGDLIHDIARNICAEMKIPLLISGVSPVQVRDVFGIDWFENPREVELKKREKSGIVDIEKQLSENVQNYFWNPEKFDKRYAPRVIFPFFGLEYDEEKIKKKVVELGLINKGSNSPIQTNDCIISLMGVVDINNLGYSSFEPEFFKLVREGKADKKFWKNIFEMLEYSAKKRIFIKKSVNEALKKLNLSKKDVGLK